MVGVYLLDPNLISRPIRLARRMSLVSCLTSSRCRNSAWSVGNAFRTTPTQLRVAVPDRAAPTKDTAVVERQDVAVWVTEHPVQEPVDHAQKPTTGSSP